MNGITLDAGGLIALDRNDRRSGRIDLYDAYKAAGGGIALPSSHPLEMKLSSLLD